MDSCQQQGQHGLQPREAWWGLSTVLLLHCMGSWNKPFNQNNSTAHIPLIKNFNNKMSPRIYQRSVFAIIQFLHKEGLWYLQCWALFILIVFDSRSYHDLWQSSQWCQCSPTESPDLRLLPGMAWPDLYSDLSCQGRQRSKTGGAGPPHRLQPILSPWLLLWPISKRQNRYSFLIYR